MSASTSSWAAEVIGTKGYDFDAYARDRVLANQNLDAWAAGTKPVASLLRQPSREARLGPFLHRDHRRDGRPRDRAPPVVHHPEPGYVENLPADAVIEVPGIIENGAYRGMDVGRLSTPVAAMVQQEIAIQELAVEAAVTGSRSLALQALLIDPCVHSAKAAEAFLDDVLSAHRTQLPAFWS